MFRDALTRLDQLEIEGILPAINQATAGAAFDPQKITVLSGEIPFYPGCRFFEVADHTVMPSRKVFMIQTPAGCRPLDWASSSIYALNKSVPIHLDEKNAIEYARFFFTFTRGRHGRFQIVETVDDIMWKDEPTPSVRKTMSGLIDPLRIVAMEDDGSYVLDTRMVFRSSLFRSRVTIAPDGGISMSDEELVIEDMPVVDDILGQ